MKQKNRRGNFPLVLAFCALSLALVFASLNYILTYSLMRENSITRQSAVQTTDSVARLIIHAIDAESNGDQTSVSYGVDITNADQVSAESQSLVTQLNQDILAFGTATPGSAVSSALAAVNTTGNRTDIYNAVLAMKGFDISVSAGSNSTVPSSVSTSSAQYGVATYSGYTYTLTVSGDGAKTSYLLTCPTGTVTIAKTSAYTTTEMLNFQFTATKD